MEHSVSDESAAQNQNATEKNKASEPSTPKTAVKNAAEPQIISPGSNAGGAGQQIWRSHGFLFDGKDQEDSDERPGEVNMEASISAEDVIKAGGFGAKDDLSSFLPVASDSTDFEESIRAARDYEEAQGEVPRPGLGWPKE